MLQYNSHNFVSDSEAYLAIIVEIMSKSENLFFATDARFTSKVLKKLLSISRKLTIQEDTCRYHNVIISPITLFL